MEATEYRPDSLAIVRGASGALLGAVVGFAIFVGLLKIGLYALMVPGALTGMGGAWLSRIRSTPVGILCLVVGASVTILCEWSQFPFIADGSLTYFITHLHQVKTMALLLGGIGIVLAFVFGRGQGVT